MNAKAERLNRLQAIRRLLEELDRRTMQMTASAVAEVEAALDLQERTRVAAKEAARLALTAGERGDWLMADAQGEVAGWNRERLGTLLAARVTAAAPAMAQFLESRREHEQVKLLLEEERVAARVAADRKAQAEADDWFLSKRLRATRQSTMSRS